jgi:uncharacterized membrane protein YjjB (DUF3815 family)
MIQYLFAFATSAAIALAFRAPLRAVPAAGSAGVIGFAAYQTTVDLGGPIMLAAFLGALAIGVSGEILARRLKEPSLLFVLPGLFPIVPGLMAYSGMLLLARQELSAAGQQLARTIFYAGALAAGLAVPRPFFRLFRQGDRKNSPGQDFERVSKK